MSVTTIRRLRRTAIVTAVLSLLTTGVLVTTIRPVGAADAWSSYALTYEGIAAGPGGGVGASGGLVVFDGGPGAVRGRLDTAPSSSAEASSVEPGTLVRLITGQANDASGQAIFGEPTTARAEYPGESTEDDATQAGPQEAGPLTITGGQATAEAGPERSTASAGVTRFEIAGQDDAALRLREQLAAWRARWVDGDGGLGAAQTPRTDRAAAVRIDGATGNGHAAADATAGTLTSEVTVRTETVTVLGQIRLEGVVGIARVAADAAGATATGKLTVGGTTVAGTPVSIGSDGVVVAGEELIAGADVEAATEQLNGALEQAGVQVRLLGSSEHTDGTTGRARSGGVAITIVTPSTSGVPRNELSLVLGRSEVTALASAAAPAPPVDVDDVVAPPAETSTSEETASAPSRPTAPTFDEAPATTDQPADVAEPRVAPPAPNGEEPGDGRVLVAGQTMTTETAFAGFAAWLLFTFTLPLLGALFLGKKG